MRRFFFFILFLACCFSASAQTLDTLFISTAQTVHLRFFSELKYVGLGNRAIVAKIVDGSKDFVAVKAREPFTGATSMSCLESSGTMHTFIVAYRDRLDRLDVDTRTFSFSPQSSADGGSPSASFTFEELTAMKPELYHIGVADYGIEIACEHVLVKDDVLFLVISVKNNSAVSYDLSSPRFAVESKRRTRRGLEYEKAIFPRNSYGLGTIKPGATSKLAFSFDKITLTRKQVLRVYFYEKGGARNFVVTLTAKDVNRAIKL